jgi:hypothetical protein
MRKGWVTFVVIVGSVATLSAQITKEAIHPGHPGKQERPATSPLRPMALAITAIR